MRRGLMTDTSGNSAAEFALVLPLALVIFFAIVDGGRYLWDVNRASKATQAGARAAAVTNMVPQGLANYSFAVTAGLPQGSAVNSSYFPGVTCDETSGTVGCNWLGTPSDAFALDPLQCAFDTIVKRMSVFMPSLKGDNVVVTYYNSGLGYAGDPGGPDVAPLISVHLRNVEFHPILTGFFGLNWPVPDSQYTVSQEDGAGWKYEEVQNANQCPPA